MSRKKDFATRMRETAERLRGQLPASVNFSPSGMRKAKERLKRPAKDAATQAALDGLLSVQKVTLDELAILRQTRGQREVGSVKVPPHLQAPMILRANPGHTHRDAREQARCPICQDRNSDAGVETRQTLLGGNE